MAEKNGSRPKPDVERLRAEIKLTRAELGETVQALAARADVKARAKAEVEQTRQRIRAQTAEATGRVREAAHAATDRMRQLTGSSQTDGPIMANAGVTGAGERIRRAPMPLTAMLIAAAAVVGVILVVRGRRR